MIAIKDQPEPISCKPYLPYAPKPSPYNLNTHTNSYKPNNNANLLPTPNVFKFQQHPTSNFKAITNKMFNEKRAKGVYFWYDR